MDVLSSKLSTLLGEQLVGLAKVADVVDVGTVISLGDGIARIYGCEACLAGELLEFADGTLGLALNLETQTVGAVRFAKTMGDYNTGNTACVEGSMLVSRSYRQCPGLGYGWHGRREA